MVAYKLALAMDLFIQALVTHHRTTCAVGETVLNLLFEQWEFCLCVTVAWPC